MKQKGDIFICHLPLVMLRIFIFVRFRVTRGIVITNMCAELAVVCDVLTL